MDLYNKNIVITGASRGLGKELARLLSIHKANLILIARNLEELEKVQQEIMKLTDKSPLIIKCDVSNENEVKNMTGIIKQKYQQIDILVNNAGVGNPKVFEKMTSEEMKKLFEINFYSVFYCIKSLLPLIKLSKAGYILNIGSILGELAFDESSIYSATKFAVNGYSQGLHYELKKYNIKVGLFMPGPMATSFHDNTDKSEFKIPSFVMLNPQKAAVILKEMIIKRKKKVYMYRWIKLLFKIRLLFE
jgi:uncharacterized protein